MEIQELHKRSDLDQNVKLKKKFLQFDMLINELKEKKVPDGLVNFINAHIKKLNEISGSGSSLKTQLKKSQYQILKKVEKELKLVVKNHIGSVIGTGSGNMSMLALGLPLGMAIGMAYGTSLDKKAKEQGKQLDLEIH